MAAIRFLCSNHKRGAAYMRGQAIFEYLQKHGVESSFDTYSGINISKIGAGDIVVCIKEPNFLVINYAISRGAKVIFDPVDNWNFNHCNGPFSFIFSNNETHADEIQKCIPSNIIVVPHAHTNVNRVRKELTKIKTLGYIGTPDQFCMPEIIEYCRNNDISWHAANPKRDKVQEETLKLDLGIVYVDHTAKTFVSATKFKPANKLSNLFSYGIPCLFTPYISYLEFIRSSHAQALGIIKDLEFMIVNSKEEIVEKVTFLRNNPEFYINLSDKCYKAAEAHHIDNIIKIYSFACEATLNPKIIEEYLEKQRIEKK